MSQKKQNVMIMNIYTIKDVFTQQANDLFLCINDDTAVRVFTDMLKKVSNPEDYILYRVGQYDTMSMQIEEDDVTKIYQHNVYNASSNLILQDVNEEAK